MATRTIKQFSLKAFKIILPLILLLCLALNLGFGSLSPVKAKDGAKEFLLTIIHTNDIHAHDEPYLYKGKMVGGLARLGHTVRDLRAKALEEEKNVIVADAGDVFQGSTLYSHYHGEVEINLMNMIGYDVFTLGNHEFDDGASNLAKQLARAKFDLINCNLDMSPVKKLNALVKPYVVKKFGDQKVAFVGAITPQMELLSGGLEGSKLKAKGDTWTAPIKKQVEELKQKGFDKIILVTHCGVDEDRRTCRGRTRHRCNNRWA
ncbi:MAG: metallophosphoesterase [Cyanobacteriota/Melainabacteria group bacterium]